MFPTILATLLAAAAANVTPYPPEVRAWLKNPVMPAPPAVVAWSQARIRSRPPLTAAERARLIPADLAEFDDGLGAAYENDIKQCRELIAFIRETGIGLPLIPKLEGVVARTEVHLKEWRMRREPPPPTAEK